MARPDAQDLIERVVEIARSTRDSYDTEGFWDLKQRVIELCSVLVRHLEDHVDAEDD